MTPIWMLFATLLSGLLCGWAALAERVALCRGAPVRWVWLMAMTGSVLLPLGPLLVRGFAGASAGEGAGTAGVGVLIGAGMEQPVVVAGWMMRLEPWILGGWAAGSAVALCSLLSAALVLRRRRRSWVPGELLGHPVRVSTDCGPAATGMLRREIVVPRWALDAPEADQRLLIAHELEHHRARDPLLLLAARIAVAVLPWNLALRWQLGRLRGAVELDCDARVLRRMKRPARSYCLLLLDAAHRARLGDTALALAAPGMLERRIRILTGELPRLPRLAAPVMIVAAVLIPLLPLVVPAPQPPTLASVRATIAARSAPSPPATLAITASGRAELLNRYDAPLILRRRYPALLREAGVGGTAIVDAFIGEDGTVREVRIGEGSGHAALDGAAIEVMQELRFAPAVIGGRPVASWIQHPVTFLPADAETAGPPVRLAIWTSPT